MRRLRRALLFVAAFWAVTCGVEAASGEAQLTKAAWDAFKGTFYQRADNFCAEFAQKYPASPRLSEMILLQARARLELSNYAGAIQLLSSNVDAVGFPKDQFVFWMAETRFREGKLAEAGGLFARVAAEFPSSPLRAEASVKQAVVAGKLNDWTNVVNLLTATNGSFHEEASTNPGAAAVLEGYFLLTEGYLKASNYAAARAVLDPLGKRPLNPTNAWAWNYLRCKIQSGSGDAAGALTTITNMAALATDAGLPALQAETAEIKGELLQQLNRWNEALVAYTNNLAPMVPAERQKQAVLRIAELSAARADLEEGADILERFARQNHGPGAESAWLKSGELRLRDFVQAVAAGEGAGSNVVSTSNRLEQASIGLQAALKQSTNNNLVADASYDLGWCYWFQNRIAESRDSFNKAASQLAPGARRTKAKLKVADAQFRLNEFASALTNYGGALNEISQLGIAETNLVEPALYQMVRAGLAAGDLTTSSNALARIIAHFPDSFFAGSAALLFGQRLGESGAPDKAREVFLDFVKKSPGAGLKPELELAIARTYEQQTAWAKAAETYKLWLEEFTNHSARAEAMFYRGQALFHAGDETNAYACFTNFVAEFPKHPLAAQAQWSIADRYFQAEAYQKAENDFQLIALNWPGTDLSFEALMMAGRAAFFRQGWTDAEKYFERVIKATNCPAALHFSAMFAYGDTLMSQVSTNKEADYGTAIEAFDKICQQYPSNYLATLACGEKAICLLQLARSGVGLTNAAEAFKSVLTNEVYADGRAMSVAKVGLGTVLEKQAAAAASPDQAALRYEALDQYLDVLDGRYLKGADGDEFWTREAAMCGVRLATDMQEWQKVIDICDRIVEKVPSSARSFDEQKRKAKENLDRGKIVGRE